MSKQQYNYDYLKGFCEENVFVLEKDYSKEKITRDTIIEGKCKEPICQGTFKKNLDNLLYLVDFVKNVLN